MPAHKSQHFVPRVLLSKFAKPGTEGRAISALDLDNGIFHSTMSVAGQCARSFYYGRSGAMEKILCDLEGEAAEAIRELIRLGPERPPFLAKHAVTLLVFIAAQHGRTPAAVAEDEARIRGIVERGLAGNFPDPTERAAAADYLVARDSGPANSTKVSVEIGSSLADLADVLVINESPIQFVTSDIGVVFHNHWAQPVRGVGVLGFACGGLQIFLPLSPHHLLIKYDPAIYAAPKSVVRVRASEGVRSLNQLQCAYAERHVYFTGDAATRDCVAALSQQTERAHRSKNIRVQKLQQTDGGAQMIMWHTEQARLDLRLPWLPVRRSMAAIPPSQRAQTFRTKAIAAIEQHSNRQPGVPPEHLAGKLFRVVDD